MRTVEIRNRCTGEVLFSTEIGDDDKCGSRTALVAAIAARAYLSGADLSHANLRGANLSDADLAGADLSHANLRGANLSDADLRDANLSGAYLRGADLRDANLRDADLRDANLSYAILRYAILRGAVLRDANLSGADLSGTDLRGADLRGANLAGIREDFRARLELVPHEVGGLLAALRAGRVLRGCHHQDKIGMAALKPDPNSPTEKWFLAIRTGDTPETNQVAAITDDWICEFLAERGEGEWIHSEAVQP